MSILSIDNLSYTYPGGQKAVLREVNAEFEPGKMYAITGPSGSGKSTLLSLLAGMETPTAGAIVCEGESLADMDLDAYRREKIAFVFQAYQLLPLLTARENVCLPMEMQGTSTEEASERADALLLSVGLPDTLHKRFPGNLSGGEQQRVGIARSFASGAKVILADEPTGNLDDENTAAIMSLLRKQVTDRGYCVIIVTHDPEVAATCAEDGQFLSLLLDAHVQHARLYCEEADRGAALAHLEACRELIRSAGDAGSENAGEETPLYCPMMPPATKAELEEKLRQYLREECFIGFAEDRG